MRTIAEIVPTAPVTVAVHAFDGVTMFHLAAPLLVFGEVARLDGTPPWTTRLWAERPGDVRTAEGNTVGGVAGPEAVADAAIVVVPSWPLPVAPPSDALRATLRDAHARGAVVAGLCLGAFALAGAGLLDGRTAVTHWDAMALLAERHPEVTVDASVLYVDHGDVLTSAGTAAALDACLHLVRTHLGAAPAAQIARHLVVAPHREGGQAQYVERPLADPGRGDPIGEVVAWALERLDEPLPVDRLARQARMSRRSFIRHFRASTGTTPARWILLRRLDESRRLLETTDWSVEHVAGACGFGSAAMFRQHFGAAFGTTPTGYRRRFSH
jgi:transcriptional regulator GlxA family with amidase domain